MTTSPTAPVRRNQADRSAETRRRILDAVVTCIEEEGFARTTSQRIARCAGVSVGAVQHHFMSKADMLRAVLEESFEELSAAFEGVSFESESVEERVEVFVDRAWRHYGSRRFRSTLEIVFGTRDVLHTPESNWAAAPMLESRGRAQGLWDSIFAGQGLSRSRQRDLLRFAFVNLAGLSMTTRFERSDAQTRRQVGLIKVALVALLETGE
jgi:AcrR family transcriptional regulator